MFKELPVISRGPITHSPSAQDPIIGIDLGTTNSLVAIVQDGKPVIIPSSEGQNLVPSVVRFLQNGAHEIGYAAKKQRANDPNNTVYSAKRLLGRGAADIQTIRHAIPFNLAESSNSNVMIRVGEQNYTPIEISALILKELKAAAEEKLGRSVEEAVITVPAYFNDSQRQATRMAGRLAGLNVLRMLNEPTAAALAYGLQKKKNGLIAVFDLGGGTFDISILKLKDGIFEVKATQGDTQLGGDDIDNAIASWLKGKADAEWPKLLEAAELLKMTLAEKPTATVTLSGKQIDLDRETLKNLSMPIIERTRTPVEAALKDAGITTAELTDVVLVGGPTRLWFIREFVGELFRCTPNTSMNPDEVVAIGAAIQADILAGNNTDFLLLDVVPLSLGIETFGGTMNKLIPRNTRIPTLAKEQFTTYVEGQTKVAINVYQGERELVADNRKLAEFVLSGIPPLPAGVARIEVTFLVDADGILSVAAKEVYSEIESSIEVRPTYGLTDSDVERMLADGLENAESDKETRKLADAKNDAAAVLTATEKSLPKVTEQLGSEEVGQIQLLVKNLKTALSGTDTDSIKQAHKALDKGTRHMAEVLMTLSVGGLKNKSAQDLLKK